MSLDSLEPIIAILVFLYPQAGLSIAQIFHLGKSNMLFFLPFQHNLLVLSPIPQDPSLFKAMVSVVPEPAMPASLELVRNVNY